ncbi:MAG: phosphohydrolase, partial [Chlorobi bacterium]|nr:phosphohydrolase [Chlorobiota bacterium]
LSNYLVFTGSISSNTYSIDHDKINILYNNNELKDITEASDMLNLSALGKISRKFYLCYPKSVVK